MDWLFTVLDGNQKVIGEKSVTAEDVAEARQAYDLGKSWDDRAVAETVFEECYESVLAKAGFTYADAERGRFDYRVTESK
jgi:hypothetical protein